MDDHESNCKCSIHANSLQQNISELDFERGIWNAAIYNDFEKIEKFIKLNKTNDRDNFGYTALHYASRNGNNEICKILIERGRADVNALTKGGVTSLQRAAMMGHLNIVKLLVDNNALLNLQDDDGHTALHRSAQNNNYIVSSFLVEKDKTLKYIKNKKNLLPYNLISKSSNIYEKLELLLKP